MGISTDLMAMKVAVVAAVFALGLVHGRNDGADTQL